MKFYYILISFSIVVDICKATPVQVWGIFHQRNLCFYGQCKDVPRTDFFKTSAMKQTSDSLASVHQQENKQAIIFVAENEIAKSVGNKAHYQLVYIVKQRRKALLIRGKAQVSWFSVNFNGLRGHPEEKLTGLS